MHLVWGKISEVLADKGFYRVNFDDRDDVSQPLPRLSLNTLGNKDEVHLDVNEHVAVLMDHHLENGVILGAIYDKNNLPQVGNKDKRVTTFSDGSFVQFDRVAKKLTISCEGDVEIIKSTKTKITASDVIELNGATSGLPKTPELVTKYNLIVTRLNGLQTVLNSWIPMPNDGGAALKTGLTAWLAGTLNAISASDIQNNKVKQ